MSGLERRLAKIEAALSPQAAVRAWMLAAHAHGSLQGYVDTLREVPDARDRLESKAPSPHGAEALHSWRIALGPCVCRCCAGNRPTRIPAGAAHNASARDH